LPHSFVISAKPTSSLSKKRFKQNKNLFPYKGIEKPFFNTLSYLTLFFFPSIIEDVQPSTSMKERKAYHWGCPYHSCGGSVQKGLPQNRSFSGPQRGFSHGPPYRPPIRPPVRRNIATNPYVRPRPRPSRNDDRDFNNLTPPSENFIPHPPASEARYYQKFSQAQPNKIKPPAVLDYRTNEKDMETNKTLPLGRYPE
jgi:hypothetical protein